MVCIYMEDDQSGRLHYVVDPTGHQILDSLTSYDRMPLLLSHWAVREHMKNYYGINFSV